MKVLNKKKIVLSSGLMALALTATLLSSCSTSREQNAAIAGSIIGGVVGHQFGSGDGKTAATVAGAVAGGVIGGNVARN